MPLTGSELFLAFIADLCIGDPAYGFHPVRIMGACISRGEALLRRWISNLYVAGFLIAFITPVVVYLVTASIVYWAYQIHVLLGVLVNVAGIYTAVSVHDLKKEALQIYTDLKNKDIEKPEKTYRKSLEETRRDWMNRKSRVPQLKPLPKAQLTGSLHRFFTPRSVERHWPWLTKRSTPWIP